MYSQTLQENILTMLVFSEKNAPTLISNLDIVYFDNKYYRYIAELCIKFYNEFGMVPKNHIADMLEDKLNNSEGTIYKNILGNIYENNNNINENYVLSELEKFIRVQQLKIAIKKSAELIQSGNINEAEDVIEQVRKTKITIFDPGIIFDKENKRLYDYKDIQEEDLIYTGIKYLDELEHVPTKKELYILVGRASSGKSWFLVHMSKMALLQRKKVLHISLELSENRLIQRYFQCLFGIAAKPNNEYKIPIFKTDKYGNLLDIEYNILSNIKNLREDDINQYLIKNMEKLSNPKLILKNFPTGSLSIKGLNSYLDNLKTYHDFIPDIILLDYLDLMDIDISKMRIDLGRTAIELSGLANERDIAMVTVAQTNSQAEGKTLITRKNLAEDFSKVRTADVLITYNCTKMERDKGLARLYVDKGRNDREGDIILITQNYAIGQFCLSSFPMRENYFGIIEQ